MGLRNKKCLITCGPTWVEIDDMRVLANRSTGELGQTLAQKLVNAGAGVTLLEGQGLKAFADRKVRIRKFLFFDDLSRLLKAELKKKYDVIIHAAAVSDFKLDRRRRGKISSDTKKLVLSFVPTPKLIKMIRLRAPKSCLVGFKLVPSSEKKALEQAARRSFKENNCDLIVANSLSKGYTGYIFEKSTMRAGPCNHCRSQLANSLVAVLDKTI